MQNKKSLLKRLMAIYIVYLIALVVGFCHAELPGSIDSFKEGQAAAHKTFQRNIGEPCVDSSFYYIQTQLAENSNFDRPELAYRVGDREVKANYTGIEMKVLHHDTMQSGAPERLSNWSSAFGLLSELLHLAVLILMGLIINSLRRSIRDDKLLPKHNITYTRIIGAMIILTEAADIFMRYLQNRAADELLQPLGLVASSSFQPSYWNLFMGIMILFTAEVFAIGHKLGEEQKLTV